MNLICVNEEEKPDSFLGRHASSIEFYRLIAYVAKRGLSTLSIFIKLPAAFSIINVVLHLIRAILNIALFWKIKNKNLGECAKVFFALAKVTISSLVLFFHLIVAVLSLLERIFFLSQLSPLKDYFVSKLAHLNIYFFYYSLAKTIYSVVLLLINFGCLLLYQDKQNKYLQNLVKHSGILTTALPMTLLMGLIINGSLIVTYFCSILIALLLVAHLVRLSYLVYQYLRLGSDEESMTRKQYYWEHIKNTSYNLCILVFSVVIVALSFCFPLTIVVAGLSIKIIPVLGLVVLTAWDLIQSYRFYSPKSIDKPKPLGKPYDPNLPMQESGYYRQENSVQYLQVPNVDGPDSINEKIADAEKKLLNNTEIVLKTWLSKTTQLQNRLNKIQSFSQLKRAFYYLEEKALNVKIKVLTNNVAVLLKNTLPNLSKMEATDKSWEEKAEKKQREHKEIKKSCFIDLILKMNTDCKPTQGLKAGRKIEREQEESEKIEIENAELTKKWENEKQCEWQTHNFINTLLDSPEKNPLREEHRLKNNQFTRLWNAYINEEVTQPRQSSLLHWSFFKQKAGSTDLDEAIEVNNDLCQHTFSKIAQLKAESLENPGSSGSITFRKCA